MTTPIDLLLSRLDKPHGQGPNYSAKCPAHDDRIASLSIRVEPDGVVLLHCHAGCDPSEVLSALGLSLSDLYPERLSDHLPPRHNGFVDLRNMVEQLDHEALVVWAAVRDIESGQTTSETLSRVALAAERIGRIRDRLSPLKPEKPLF